MDVREARACAGFVEVCLAAIGAARWKCGQLADLDYRRNCRPGAGAPSTVAGRTGLGATSKPIRRAKHSLPLTMGALDIHNLSLWYWYRARTVSHGKPPSIGACTVLEPTPSHASRQTKTGYNGGPRYARAVSCGRVDDARRFLRTSRHGTSTASRRMRSISSGARGSMTVRRTITPAPSQVLHLRRKNVHIRCEPSRLQTLHGEVTKCRNAVIIPSIQ